MATDRIAATAGMRPVIMDGMVIADGMAIVGGIMLRRATTITTAVGAEPTFTGYS